MAYDLYTGFDFSNYAENILSKEDKEIAVALGKMFEARRKELGLNQTELGEKFGFTQSYISCILKGSRIISAATMLKMCAYLGISLSSLERTLFLRKPSIRRPSAEDLSYQEKQQLLNDMRELHTRIEGFLIDEDGIS